MKVGGREKRKTRVWEGTTPTRIQESYNNIVHHTQLIILHIVCAEIVSALKMWNGIFFYRPHTCKCNFMSIHICYFKLKFANTYYFKLGYGFCYIVLVVLMYSYVIVCILKPSLVPSHMGVMRVHVPFRFIPVQKIVHPTSAGHKKAA